MLNIDFSPESQGPKELHLFRPRFKELFQLNLGKQVQITTKHQQNKTSLLWLPKIPVRQISLFYLHSLLDRVSPADG